RGRAAGLGRARRGAGARGGAAALLTPEAHVWTDPAPFVALARRSLELLRALDDDWGGAVGVEPLEWLVALPQALPLETDLGPLVDVLHPAGAPAIEPQVGDGPG